MTAVRLLSKKMQRMYCSTREHEIECPAASSEYIRTLSQQTLEALRLENDRHSHTSDSNNLEIAHKDGRTSCVRQPSKCK